MVKVTSVTNMDYSSNKAVVSIMADTKSEITPDMEVKGLPTGFAVDFGSDVMTTSGEVAFMKSDGTWSWL